MTDTFFRPALGQVGSLGGLYDARVDKFLNQTSSSFFPKDSVKSVKNWGFTTSVHPYTGLKARQTAFNVSHELGASLMAGFLQPRGAGSLLSDHDLASRTFGALHHSFKTVEDSLEFQSPHFKDFLGHLISDFPNATHLVTKVQWGATSAVAVHKEFTTSTTINDDERVEILRILEKWDRELQSETPVDTLDGQLQSHQGSRVSIYSDILTSGSILVTGLDEATEFFNIVQLEAKDRMDGKGWPISYHLMPLPIVKMVCSLESPPPALIQSISDEILWSFVDAFNIIYERNLSILEEIRVASQFKRFLSPRTLMDLQESWQASDAYGENFIRDFGQLLKAVRENSRPVRDLDDLLQQHRQNPLNHIPPVHRDLNMSRLLYLQSVVSKGAIYLGHNTHQPQKILKDLARKQSMHLMSFRGTMPDHDVWNETASLFDRIVDERHGRETVPVLLDCDVVGTFIESPLISLFQNGEKVEDDILSQERFKSENCLAECELSTIEEKHEMPSRRRWVKIPCPGSKCKQGEVCEWKCSRCMTPLEFGFVDDYIYCACGRSDYKNYRFKCNGSSHGTEYIGFSPPVLHAFLKSLDASNYLNILILGETGVGKSTFINALVNYLEYESLDHALNREELTWLIPCSFSLQIMDREKPDSDITEHQISIGSGSRADEKDSTKGESATQRTAVYPVTFESEKGVYTVRLIDTPGIGDTRGVEYDKKNMQDILSTLGGYDDLHGILILLKPNASRLTLTFEYCVKELLTHLHQSAALNMVFGFTNTKMSNYSPGDTFTPLKALLEQHQNMGIKLGMPTVYCFDSESFRYLAAAKQKDIHMPNKPEFDRSWDMSRKETLRLMGYFENLDPHTVRSTLSLNQTRQLILSLTKPMAQISQMIRTNIAGITDEVEDLRRYKMTRDQLKGKLSIQKKVKNTKKLDMPRTVCRHHDCTSVETQDDGFGKDVPVVIYDSHCHPECWLDNVEAETEEHPGLIYCAAFDGDNCSICTHSWRQHWHVLYELVPKTIMVNDPTIEDLLKQNADNVTIQTAAIGTRKQLVRDYEQEQEIIGAAAAKFVLFLKKNSIMSYNDATEAYLLWMMEEEKRKTEAGFSNKKLRALQEDVDRHREAVKLLQSEISAPVGKQMGGKPDMSLQGIQRTVDHLYGLVHFGETLRGLQFGISEAVDATNRERPHTIKRPRKLRDPSGNIIRGGSSTRKHTTQQSHRGSQWSNGASSSSSSGTHNYRTSVQHRIPGAYAFQDEDDYGRRQHHGYSSRSLQSAHGSVGASSNGVGGWTRFSNRLWPFS